MRTFCVYVYIKALYCNVELNGGGEAAYNFGLASAVLGCPSYLNLK